MKISYMDKIIHEMKSPIHSLGLLCEVMLESGSVPINIDTKEIFKLVQDSVEKLSKIVNLLSTVNHTGNFKSSRAEPNFKEFNLLDLVSKEVKYHQGQNRTNPDLKIELVNKVTACRAKVDEFWFRQLIANLIINAVNHTPKGLIEVCTDITDKDGIMQFSLSVRDEGCGIPEEELETIFLPLKRGSHSIGKVPGSGIGLAIVKEVVETHGGSITARNDATAGAIFELSIPLIHEEW